MVAHTCNLSTFGWPRLEDHLNPGVPDQPRQLSETLPLKNKNDRLGVVAHALIPALWEAEA